MIWIYMDFVHKGSLMTAPSGSVSSILQNFPEVKGDFLNYFDQKWIDFEKSNPQPAGAKPCVK